MPDKRTVVVLPHADPSVRLVAPGRSDVHNLHQRAVARIVGAQEVSAPAGGELRTILHAAARATLAGRADPVARLAASATMLALCDPGQQWSVRLRLDDLELVEGSTERGADVRRAAADLPFGPELAAAVELAGHDPIFWIDRDQQLPALAALASRVDRPVRVAGGFALEHWRVLRTWLPAGSRPVALDAYWETDVGGVPGRRGQTAGAAAEPVRWLSRPRVAGGPRRRWADEITGEELGHPERLPEGCAAAVLGIAGADEQGIVTGDGSALDWETVAASVKALTGGGVRVLVEQLLAAPGHTADSAVATARCLAGGDLGWRVVGCRPFHLPPEAGRRGRAGGLEWGGRRVAARPASDRDLPRSIDYGAADLAPVVPEIVRYLRGRHRLAMQRVARFYLRDAGRGQSLAPGVVVHVSGGGCWLVDLAAVRVMRLDPRIGRRLAALGPGEPVPAAFPDPDLARSVAGMLARAGALDQGAP